MDVSPHVLKAWIYIESITRLDIPRTVRIVEYSFGVTSYGAAPFFAKMEMNQEDYEALVRYFMPEPDPEDRLYEFYGGYGKREFERMKRDFDYEGVRMGDIVEIGWRDNIMSRSSIFFMGSSRHPMALLMSTVDGRFFLYVFYRN